MSLRVETNFAFGIPKTWVPGFGAVGIGGHWTAGGRGRAGALQTIQHFITTRWSVNASYHILVFREAGHTVAMWVVEPQAAAHSLAPSQAFQLNPAHDQRRQLDRFAEVRRILGAKAADPNAAIIAISFCGMPADLSAALREPGFVDDMRQLIREISAIPTMANRPLFGHGWIQPITRYELDEAPGGPDMLIGHIYTEAPAPTPTPEEDDMPPVILRPVKQRWLTGAGDFTATSALASVKPGGQFWMGGPALGEMKLFTEPEEVRSIAETADGKWRLILYVTPDAAELFWMHRNNLRPIAASREPATGYGLDLGTGVSPGELGAVQDGAFDAGAIVGRDAAAKAAAAAALPRRGDPS